MYRMGCRWDMGLAMEFAYTMSLKGSQDGLPTNLPITLLECLPSVEVIKISSILSFICVNEFSC